MQPEPARIAVWSGPRNISTAMLRSWGARADCTVSDEPLYAHYLTVTGADHPGRDEILQAHESDWRRIVEHLTGPVPGDRPIWYQKHMAHHLTPEMDRSWLLSLSNAMLIRDPAEMITSFIKVIPDPTPEDLGLPQQAELSDWIERQTGNPPPVIDARDVLENPESMLRALCHALGVPWDPAMLSWAPGPCKTDGVWAKHWYDSVYRSTAFAPYRPHNDPVPDPLVSVHARCRELYDSLHARRLTP
ncbi:MAG: hypothetical protein JJU33_06015 [Phycisphaerales bacterium]|nr:hypothetical protein [Phycisphaerales bacterium]